MYDQTRCKNGRLPRPSAVGAPGCIPSLIRMASVEYRVLRPSTGAVVRALTLSVVCSDSGFLQNEYGHFWPLPGHQQACGQQCLIRLVSTTASVPSRAAEALKDSCKFLSKRFFWCGGFLENDIAARENDSMDDALFHVARDSDYWSLSAHCFRAWRYREDRCSARTPRWGSRVPSEPGLPKAAVDRDSVCASSRRRDHGFEGFLEFYLRHIVVHVIGSMVLTASLPSTRLMARIVRIALERTYVLPVTARRRAAAQAEPVNLRRHDEADCLMSLHARTLVCAAKNRFLESSSKS